MDTPATTRQTEQAGSVTQEVRQRKECSPWPRENAVMKAHSGVIAARHTHNARSEVSNKQQEQQPRHGQVWKPTRRDCHLLGDAMRHERCTQSWK
jgi:hypothetical protein